MVVRFPRNATWIMYVFNFDDGDANGCCIVFVASHSLSCSLSSFFSSQILFSVPHGLSDDNVGSFWAKGSAGDSRRFSVYSGGDYNFEGGTFDGGFFVPSTIMHE